MFVWRVPSERHPRLETLQHQSLPPTRTKRSITFRRVFRQLAHSHGQASKSRRFANTRKVPWTHPSEMRRIRRSFLVSSYTHLVQDGPAERASKPRESACDAHGSYDQPSCVGSSNPTTNSKKISKPISIRSERVVRDQGTQERRCKQQERRVDSRRIVVLFLHVTDANRMRFELVARDNLSYGFPAGRLSLHLLRFLFLPCLVFLLPTCEDEKRPIPNQIR